MTSHLTNLLPCPFCGDDDLLPMRLSSELWEVYCDFGECPARPTAYGRTEAEAIVKWNTRVNANDYPNAPDP